MAALATALDTPQKTGTSADYDIDSVRRDFPILATPVHGRAFLDSGASAQKPRAVIDAMREVMEESYTNVHRGAHFLSLQLSERYEAVRQSVARFINARCLAGGANE